MVLGGIFGKTIGEPDSQRGKQKVRKALDDLMAYASEKRFEKKMEQARDYYYSKVGKVNEDDPDFVQRMNTFLEWFIFDHRPDGEDTLSLFDLYLSEKLPNMQEDDVLTKLALSRNYHSIFLVKACSRGVIHLKDLVGKNRYVVTEDDRLEPGDIIEARIIQRDKGCFLSHTHCLHPKDAYEPMMAELKKRKGIGMSQEVFFLLQKMQLKWRRFRQVKVKDIYKV